MSGFILAAVRLSARTSHTTIAPRTFKAAATIQSAVRRCNTPSSSSFTPRTSLCFNTCRSLTTSVIRCNTDASTSAASASPLIDSTPRDVKIMAHYVGTTSFEGIVLPAVHANRAYRFTQPNSVLIPLDTPTSTTAVGASRSLSELFTLPPIPVAPIVRIPSASSTPSSAASVLPSSSSLAFESTKPFMVAFGYGAVVFFNVPESQQQDILQKVVSTSGKDSSKLKDDYKIIVTGRQQDAFTACRFLTDSVEVTGLDLNSVRIFSQILSQAVAMQHYESEAHRLLIKLRTMLRSPTLGHQRSELIVRYVAESSTAMVDVLTELKLLDRSEIVWGSGQYDPLWSGLRREFDLTDRFEAMQTKLDLLRDGRDVLLSLTQHASSRFMEIIIIALIAIEVVLAIVFHSPLIPTLKETMGYGEQEQEEEGKKKLAKH